MKIKAFITHKLKEKYSDCQDYFRINEDNLAIAVSDGMSQSIFSGWWAEILTQNFVDKPQVYFEEKKQTIAEGLTQIVENPKIENSLQTLGSDLQAWGSELENLVKSSPESKEVSNEYNTEVEKFCGKLKELSEKLNEVERCKKRLLTTFQYAESFTYWLNHNTIQPLQRQWLERVQRHIDEQKQQNNPHTRRTENSINEKKGAGATLCGIRFKRDNDGEENCKYDVFVLGDTSVIQLSSENEIVGILSTCPNGYGNHPDYFDSFSLGRGEAERISGELRKGEKLLVVSDPFAEFFFNKKQKGEDYVPYISELLTIENHDAYCKLVDRWRQKENLHNDDSTMVLVEFDDKFSFTEGCVDDLEELRQNEIARDSKDEVPEPPGGSNGTKDVIPGTSGGSNGTEGGDTKTSGGSNGTEDGNTVTSGGSNGTEGGNAVTSGGSNGTEGGDTVTSGGSNGTEGVIPETPGGSNGTEGGNSEVNDAHSQDGGNLSNNNENGEQSQTKQIANNICKKIRRYLKKIWDWLSRMFKFQEFKTQSLKENK